MKSYKYKNSTPLAASIFDNVVILDELKNFIPPISDSEYLNLKESIAERGVTDKIWLWQIPGDEENIKYAIVDGHNRYKICQELGISSFPYNIISDINDVDEIKLWMVKHQTSRRNLKHIALQYVVGNMYNSMVTKRGGDNSKKENVAKILSDRFSISERSVRHYAAIAKGLDNFTPQQRHIIFTSKEKITVEYLKAMNESIKEAIDEDKEDDFEEFKTKKSEAIKNKLNLFKIRVEALAQILSKQDGSKVTYQSLTKQWMQEGLERYLQMNPHIDLDVVEETTSNKDE